MEREDAKDILIWMLNQVKRAEIHKKELTERLMRINAERENPIGSPGYDPMPRSSGKGDGAASILFKLADIEDRIYEQRTEIENSYVRVMDIIDFIPQAETARRIFELRHLDCLGFQDVADAIPMSRSRVYDIYNETLDKLLDFPKISKMVDENEKDYLQWYMDREERRRKAEKSSGGYKSQNRNRKKKWKK